MFHGKINSSVFEHPEVVVVGGGAAGMFAAGRAAENGKKVLLIERNDRLGRKLLITGKGRCNVTNDGDIKEFIEKYGRNGRFLYRAFSEYFNEDIIAFFGRYSVEMKSERGGRVFPVTDKAESIIGALETYLNAHNVKLRLNSRVKSIVVETGESGEKKVCGVGLDNKVIPCSSVILATGGLSYPGTGSTGDGYRIAEETGHTIVAPRAALVPLETREDFVKEIQGLSLKNVEATVIVDGKRFDSEFGEMLFTHFGVSGPIILRLSAGVVEQLEEKKKVVLSINFKPALDKKTLDNRLLREFNENGLKTFSSVIKSLLPASLVPVFIRLLAIADNKKCNQVNAGERRRVAELLSDFRLEITRARPIAEAIITRGGISLKEIDPHTMGSLKIKGLFFCGELIDIDGVTGGYNLQAAFSTGYLAGKNA